MRAIGPILALGMLASIAPHARADDGGDDVAALAPGERALLERGELSSARHIGGSVAAYLAGFGVGHLIQGRWRERGWWFTVGELAAASMFFVASVESDLDTTTTNVLGVTGIVGIVGLRVGATLDAALVPRGRNRRVRALRRRLGLGASAYMLPLPAGGAAAGLVLRF